MALKEKNVVWVGGVWGVSKKSRFALPSTPQEGEQTLHK
jgi:hypothetical protein